MNEKLIEKKLKEEVKKLGGIAIKIYSKWFTGLPDRLIMLPGGRLFWAELKSTGKELSPRQRIVIPMLMGLGFTVFIIDDENKLEKALNRMHETAI